MGNQESIWDKLYKERLTWKKETINLPNLLKGKDVLELGVGTGKTLISILKQNPRSVTAIDISQEALTQAAYLVKSENVKFAKSNILDFQSDEKFDIIICYYVLNNLIEKERKEAIIRMHKALKPHGIIIFEDFAIGDFREKEGIKNIESHTTEREDGLICHFFGKKEVESLFKTFKIIKLSDKTFHPIRKNQKIERKIMDVVARK